MNDRRTLHPRPGFKGGNNKPRFNGGANHSPKAKGHDAYLKDLQDSGAIVQFGFSSDGSNITGKIIGRDKFTITVLPGTYDKGFSENPTVIYKHALDMFGMIQKAPVQPEADTTVMS